MSKQDKMKLAIAVVILILAALLLAWNFGLFEGKSGTTVPPAGPAGAPPPPSGTQGGGPVGG